jgi:hypothetical protein
MLQAHLGRIGWSHRQEWSHAPGWLCGLAGVHRLVDPLGDACLVVLLPHDT